MIFKTMKLDVKQVNANSNTIEGYAAYFNNRDAHGHIIVKGAFAKTLKENANRVKVLWQHEQDEPIGKPIEMYEDDKGLYIKAFISQTEKGAEVMTLLRDGVLDEMSIGVDIIKEEYDANTNVLYLKELRLWEFSIVTFAANEMAKVTSVKNLERTLKNVDKSDILAIEKAIAYLKTLIQPPQRTNEEEEIGKLLEAIKSIKSN